MLKAVIYQFSKEGEDIRKETASSITSKHHQNLTDYWLIEGPRSYRQSILSDKIHSSEPKYGYHYRV